MMNCMTWDLVSRTQTFSPFSSSFFLPPPALVALRWIWEQVGPWVVRMGQHPLPKRNWWVLISLPRGPEGPRANTGQRCSNMTAATILSPKSCRRCGRDEISSWKPRQKPRVFPVFDSLSLASYPNACPYCPFRVRISPMFKSTNRASERKK